MGMSFQGPTILLLCSVSIWIVIIRDDFTLCMIHLVAVSALILDHRSWLVKNVTMQRQRVEGPAKFSLLVLFPHTLDAVFIYIVAGKKRIILFCISATFVYSSLGKETDIKGLIPQNA